MGITGSDAHTKAWIRRGIGVAVGDGDGDGVSVGVEEGRVWVLVAILSTAGRAIGGMGVTADWQEARIRTKQETISAFIEERTATLFRIG